MKKKVVLSVAVVLLVVMVAVMCVACTPNPDNLKSKVKEKGYVTIPSGILSLSKDITDSLAASNGEEVLVVIWYKDSDTCKSAYEKAQDNKDLVKDFFGDKEFKVVKRGTAVCYGTKEAIKLV